MTKTSAHRLDIKFEHGGATAQDWRTRLCNDLGRTIPLQVGEGWQHIVERLFAELRRYRLEDLVARVYERHAGLALRANGWKPEPFEAIERHAQVLSFRTCSRCGKVGSHHARARRLETTCEPCHEHLMKEDPDGRYPAR